MRVYNFAAGPSMLPEEVLLEAQASLLDYEGTGMSVMEMSHRGKPFMKIAEEAEALLRELMHVPEDYDVLFLQGGASTQFEAVPLNLTVNGKADYVVTGNFAKKAWKEAAKYTDAVAVASSEEANFTYIPDLDTAPFRPDADYVHITTNNTIFGTRYAKIPQVPTTLVADMSSNILSEPVDVTKFGLIYAGAQKNVAPAGVTIVIVRKDLLGHAQKICPTMLNYVTQAKEHSLYNTPPCFCIYMAMLNLRYLKAHGGVEAAFLRNKEKAAVLYDYIDGSGFYRNGVKKEDRSLMNVPFVTPSKELDEKFVAEAAKNGLVSLKGHRLVGGMRASIYNAMPKAGVEKLIAFMKDFAKENAL